MLGRFKRETCTFFSMTLKPAKLLLMSYQLVRFMFQWFELSREHRVHTFLGYSCLIYNTKGKLIFKKFGSDEGVLSSKWSYVQVFLFAKEHVLVKSIEFFHEV